jgi:hypothetical protein
VGAALYYALAGRPAPGRLQKHAPPPPRAPRL